MQWHPAITNPLERSPRGSPAEFRTGKMSRNATANFVFFEESGKDGGGGGVGGECRGVGVGRIASLSYQLKKRALKKSHLRKKLFCRKFTVREIFVFK